MLENKWNNIAPEVPQDFHNKFEDTLKQIEQADSVDKKYKRKKISGRLLIAAAVICTGMAVTVAAKEFFKWNDYLVKRLDPSEEQQETLQESTYIQNIDQSVTQNGVTVTLTDSIQDQGFLYAFFEVKTEDSISMTDHTSFEEMTHFKIDGKEVYAVDDNRFGSFNTGVGQDVLLKTDQNSTHLKYFNACISYDGDYDLSNKTVEITLKNLTEEGDYDTTVITDGTWDFKWTLGAVKPPTTLEVNRKCDFGGYEITVKKMEVTPLLWSLYLDYDEAMKVYEDEKNKFEYTGTDYGMDLCRGDLVVAVGGGVVGDLAGFAASIYMRGIDFINCPTTTLSMIDSSIGGKTAVDLGDTKNIVGAFWQPKLVIVDPDTLATLPRRHFINGLAEAVKASLLADPELFAIFENGDVDAQIGEIICRSLRFKKNIVEQDETEQGMRKALNFGHTIGHGIEAVKGIKGRRTVGLYHGECVALGMLPMIESKALQKRVRAVYRRLGLPTRTTYDKEKVLAEMLHDKKAQSGQITIIKVPGLGCWRAETIPVEGLRPLLGIEE